MPRATAVDAGILGMMPVAIGMPMGMLRASPGVPLGDGGNPKLLWTIRRHGNLMAWVPWRLLRMAMRAMSGVSTQAIDRIGASRVVARPFHAIGLGSGRLEGAVTKLRAAGTTLIVVVVRGCLVASFVRGRLAGFEAGNT